MLFAKVLIVLEELFGPDVYYPMTMSLPVFKFMIKFYLICLFYGATVLYEFYTPYLDIYFAKNSLLSIRKRYTKIYRKYLYRISFFFWIAMFICFYFPDLEIYIIIGTFYASSDCA